MAGSRKFFVEFEDGSAAGGAHRSVPDPPGFSLSIAREGGSNSQAPNRRRDVDLQKKQAALHSRATAPFKQVAFMCFMMFMSGNSIQIFSLMMTLSGIATPLQAILKSGEEFPPDETGMLNTIGPRIVYSLIQALQLFFALYKLNAMGLLPSHASDWVSALVVPEAREFSSGGIDI